MGECIFFFVEKVNVNVLSYFYYYFYRFRRCGGCMCKSVERVREEAVEKEEGKRGGRCSIVCFFAEKESELKKI